MQEFVAYPSRWRLILMALGAVLFVVAGLWMIGLFGPPPESRRYSAGILMVIGWISILLFGGIGVAIIKRMFSTQEQVRITTQGIFTRDWSDDMIPWSEIIDVSTWSSNGQSMVVLHLRDPSRFPGRGMLAKLAKANKMLTGGDIHISMTGTDRSFDEAMQAIRHYWR